MLAPLAGDWIAYQAWEDPTRYVLILVLRAGRPLLVDRTYPEPAPSIYRLLAIEPASGIERELVKVEGKGGFAPVGAIDRLGRIVYERNAQLAGLTAAGDPLPVWRGPPPTGARM